MVFVERGIFFPHRLQEEKTLGAGAFFSPWGGGALLPPRLRCTLFQERWYALQQRTARTSVKSLGETCRTLLPGTLGKARRLGEAPLP